MWRSKSVISMILFIGIGLILSVLRVNNKFYKIRKEGIVWQVENPGCRQP
jgi:hypothetical protein